MRKRMAVFFVFVLVITLVACSTSPLGRRQLTLFPSAEINQMGATAFEQMQQETPSTDDGRAAEYVRCITDALLQQVNSREADLDWEVEVFRDDSVNAFALPGGKVGVFTGLLDVAENQHQLAAVIGHEIGHVIAEHGNERMSTSFATGAGLQLIQILSGEPSPQQQQIMGLLGLGTQVGIILPFGRTQESEADYIGLEMMAKAGFDPRESVDLWKNMAEASGNGPPEFLSTHPSSDTRIRELRKRMDDAVQLYEAAVEEGRSPDCRIAEASAKDSRQGNRALKAVK